MAPPVSRQTPGIYDLSWFIMEIQLKTNRRTPYRTTDDDGIIVVVGQFGVNTLELGLQQKEQDPQRQFQDTCCLLNLGPEWVAYSDTAC